MDVEVVVLGDVEWNKLWFKGHGLPRSFYAEFSDGSERELTGVIVKHGETLPNALDRTRKEIGAVAIRVKAAGR